MFRSRALAGLAVIGILVVTVFGVGRVFGVGPMAPAVPPDQVTDPKEMVARSLQSTLDASAVHFDGTVTGSIAGSLVDRSEPTITLDGTKFVIDIRPKDAKTKAHVDSEPLGVNMDTVTVWDGVWFRTDPDQPWQRASLGGASAEAGVDINPLTLVDRLRSYLATPGIKPATRDVPCSSASGRCHEITLDAGSDQVKILSLMLPKEQSDRLPPVDLLITLQTDAETLRPAHLVVDGTSADGSVDIHAAIDVSDWDGNSVIDEPVEGS